MINAIRKEGLKYGVNFGSRNGKTVKYVVIHATQSSTFESAFNGLRAAGTGYHYVVDGKTVYECVDPQFAAYHAGDLAMNRESLGVAHVAIKGQAVNEDIYPTSGQFIADYLRANGLLPTRDVIKPHREVRPKKLVFWGGIPKLVETTECPANLDMDRLMGEIVKFYYGVSTPEPVIPQDNPQPGEIPGDNMSPYTVKVVGTGTAKLAVRSEATILAPATAYKNPGEQFTIIGSTVDKDGMNIQGNGTWLNTGYGYVHSLYTQKIN